MPDDVPELVVPDAAAWRAWLEAHHAEPAGVWLRLARKGTTEPTSLGYDEALRAALCFGWIDGQVQRYDASTYRQRFTPRRARSPWSARNVGIVAGLEAAGLMTEAGRAEVERARADGRWAVAYAGPATAEVPADLAAAVAADPQAAATWEILTKQNRYAVIWR
ncbi:MAG: YdeI/OmpD-associated family protein, partial [Frankiaceae bacterium]|nr:YdeI/OmpD-associated family protein [Frankiaceae bacterium]